jgi:acyl-CoA thioesterase-2
VEGDGHDGGLEQAILASLDGLLGALVLQPSGADRFRVRVEPGRFDRIFGGQSIAQALLAASATVAGKEPHSLHAYFVEAGLPDEPVDLAVEHVRDGRSFATRRVNVTQGDRVLLVAIASFHANPDGPELSEPIPSVPPPDQLPTLQDWALALPAERREHGRVWVDHPPPLDIRMGEAPSFFTGASGDGPRSHWMRLPRAVGDDPLLHTALLTYASDYLLLDMIFRSYPGGIPPNGFTGFSLDHALWFHRPVRFDQWHLHTQQTTAISADRGLAKGMLHDADGHLVASVMQEVLVRPRR